MEQNDTHIQEILEKEPKEDRIYINLRHLFLFFKIR